MKVSVSSFVGANTSFFFLMGLLGKGQWGLQLGEGLVRVNEG